MDILEIGLIASIVILTLVLFVWALFSSLIIVQGYEIGVYMRFGRHVRNLRPGVHLVTPFVSRVFRADTRIQTLDPGRQEIMSKDLSPTVVETLVQYRLTEPDKCIFKIEKYRSAFTQIAQANMRKIALLYDLEDLIRHQGKVNDEFRKTMAAEAGPFGIEIVRTEIKDIDPAGPIKAAIEDRIAAERERQAMILRADGRKRALIMENEGRRTM
ncbi:MAG: SPFH/Band 7/PHB domain protein [Candidatus Thermoplasmatota archaeon]|nr:SPFH/Band 7/PHB domain protein [Candidatus Thermoplasmatota archaeon]